MRKRWSSSAEGTSFGGLNRSTLMSRIRSRGNGTTELRLAFLLRKHCLVGWRRHQRLVGRPDFVWPEKKLIVFVDGCFWHGHQCGRNLTPKRNVTAWRTKITGNQRRDLRVSRALRSLGWKVIRVWECALAKTPRRCIQRIQRAYHAPLDRAKKKIQRFQKPRVSVLCE